MKPFSSIQNHRNQREDRFPVVDCNYRPLGLGDLNAHCAKLPNPSFSAISRDYFNGEARANFAIEAIVFGLVALTTVPALLDCARATFEFVRAIGLA